MMSAVAGATRTSSPVSAIQICFMRGSVDRNASSSSMTRWREKVWNVRGPTNWQAARVIIVTTSAPDFVRRRNTSTALNAAMLPLTPRTIVLPSSARVSLMDPSIQFGENGVSAVKPCEATAIGENNGLELLRGRLQVVVHDDIIVMPILGHFRGGDGQSGTHRRLVVGVALSQTLLKGGQ